MYYIYPLRYKRFRSL